MSVLCGPQDLKPVLFSECEPVILLSEIRRVFIAKTTADPFSNWSSNIEWNTRLDQTTTTGDNYIRALTVIGDIPAPTDAVKEISNNRTFLLRRSRQLNLTIDDLSDENYEFLQDMETGIYVRLWYESHSGKMYGGNSGIVLKLTATPVKARGKDEIDVWNLTGNWDALRTEDRTDSPIFESGTSGGGSFDTVLIFSAAVTDSDGGVTGTAPAINADLQFSFDEITPTIGTPLTMLIKVHESGAVTPTLQLTVDFPSDYLGAPFLFVDAQGFTQTGGNFVVGDVEFTN